MSELETKKIETKKTENKKTVEQLRKEKSPPEWAYAAAKAYNRWPIGFEITEADFDTAIFHVANLRIR